MLSQRRGIIEGTLVCVVALGIGCADPRGRLDDFAGRVTDANTNRVDAEVLTSIPDITGNHLFALSASAFPAQLYKFRAEVTLIDGTGDEPKISFTLHPLDARNNVEIDAPISHDPDPIDVSPTTGEWEAHIVAVIPDKANPVSGSEVTVDMTLFGVIRSRDHFCGTADGDVVDPFTLNLDGSTFGAVRIPDGSGPGDVEPTGVCLTLPDDPDAGVPDAGAPDAGTPDAGAPDAGAPDAGADAAP